MSNRYFNRPPLPYENNALTLFAEERPSVDVVKPAPVARPRLHSDGLDARVPGASSPPPSSTSPVTSQPQQPLVPHVPTTTISTATTETVGTGDRGGEDHPDDNGYDVSREELLQLDHDDREACRAAVQRERDERSALRHSSGPASSPSTCRFGVRETGPCPPAPRPRPKH